VGPNDAINRDVAVVTALEIFAIGIIHNETAAPAAGLHYSYGLIARSCSPESQQDPENLWIHSLFRV